jgi:hypothetical protein
MRSPMSDIDAIVARLQQHRTLGQAPIDELRWLAEHGELRSVGPGDVVTTGLMAVVNLIVVLSGRFAIHVDHGYGPRKVMEWGPGDISGMLPYSRLTKAPGDAIVSESGDLFLVHRDHFDEMIRT